MDIAMKKGCVILLGCICMTNATCAEPNPIETYSQKIVFKNWVLSHCLANAHKARESKKDAEVTASAYLEFGNAPIEAYEEGDILAKKILAKVYGGSIKNPMNTMKCIDLFHSKDLEILTRKYITTKKR